MSPHPDDVALACGGSVAADVAAGEHVVLVTLFGSGADGAVREQEDGAAAGVLGCALHRLGLPEALERAETRSPLDLFAPLGPQHLGVLAECVARLRQVVQEVEGSGSRPVLAAPLAVGGHIDHRLTHGAARAVADELELSLFFYEDQPYSLARYALGRRLAAVAAALLDCPPPERAPRRREVAAYRRYLRSLPLVRHMAPPGLRWLMAHLAARAAVKADDRGREPGFALRLRPRLREVEAFASQRFAAIAAYASQQPRLFPSAGAMERAMRAHGGGPGGALVERFWDVVPPA